MTETPDRDERCPMCFSIERGPHRIGKGPWTPEWCPDAFHNTHKYEVSPIGPIGLRCHICGQPQDSPRHTPAGSAGCLGLGARRIPSGKGLVFSHSG